MRLFSMLTIVLLIATVGCKPPTETRADEIARQKADAEKLLQFTKPRVTHEKQPPILYSIL